MLERMWNHKCHALLVGCKMIPQLWKIVLLFLLKLNIFTMWFSNCAPWYLPKEQNLHDNVSNSFIHNCQNLETTNMCFKEWMDKLVDPDNEMIFNTKRNELSSHKKTQRNLKYILIHTSTTWRSHLTASGKETTGQCRRHTRPESDLWVEKIL